MGDQPLPWVGGRQTEAKADLAMPRDSLGSEAQVLVTLLQTSTVLVNPPRVTPPIANAFPDMDCIEKYALAIVIGLP